jgi:hypothetical protein
MKFRIVSVGEGKFTIEYKGMFGWKPFKIHDIHPGHGGKEIWPMQATKKDCEKVMRFLRISKTQIKTTVHWEVMDRIRRKLGIKYMYLQREYTPTDIPELHQELNIQKVEL